MTEETHANRFRRIVRLRRGRSQTSEETDSQEPSSSEEAHEQESAASDTSSKSAKASKKRRTSRKIRRYEVPIGTDGSTQTVLRFKPLGFWKMFAAVMLGFFTGLMLFLAAAVLAVIILGGILWGVVKDRVGDWVVDVANQVSDELDEAEQSVSNIADRVDQTVENVGENVDDAVSQAGSTASSVVAQASGDSDSSDSS